MHPYWIEQEHHRWQTHYTEGCYGGGRYLAFTKAFRDGVLPKEMHETNHAYELLIEVLDKRTGKHYECKHCVSYEHEGSRLSVMDADWNEVRVEHLQDYFYGCHFCGCHVAHHVYHHKDQRIEGYHDVELSDDDRCPRGRFRLVKVVWEKMPELILMSETMGEEELETALFSLKGAPQRINPFSQESA